ncbi:MAG: inositol-3-phosphate synthase [Bacteroidetes bacterium]|nr:inositol-3-phosphate synthase [Bacteroidota bacterium]
MSKIRIAIVGVGNCANSLIQGVEYYRNVRADEKIPGLMHNKIGNYCVDDIEFSASFDVNVNKVGKDLAQAIWETPNNTVKFAEVPTLGVKVLRGPTMDGLGTYLNKVIVEANEAPVDVAQVLKETRTDILINYLPVGSELATRWYAQQAINAHCGFINCIPVFIASDTEWKQKFLLAGLPIIGDDIKSQVGATIVHRCLTKLFMERGIHLDRTYQLNFGGNMDFYNMLERERLESKKISKTGAVMSQLTHELPVDEIHIGPSDYVPWLTDRKWCHIYMEGTTFGGVPLKIELKLEVWDSPNSAGIVIDAIRCMKIALNQGLSGPLIEPSSYFMKSPPQQFTDDEAYRNVENFILRTCEVNVA